MHLDVHADLDELDAKVSELKRRGWTRANKSEHAAAGYKNVGAGALVLNVPLSPPRAFTKADATVAPNELHFKGPLLYLRTGKRGEVAVAHDGDTIVVWRPQVLEADDNGEEHINDWFEQARIKLAPGAKVTAG